MKKTIDLTYVEISDDQKGKKLYGISTQTAQDAIKNLEQRYFQGRNLFRNGDIGSDYLFRWEISNLLKLLIWLEVKDIFNDNKMKKSGVSALNIEKIIESYNFVSKEDSLKWYERVMMETSVQAKESKETLEYMQKAFYSMTRFLLLSAISYNQYPNDIFKSMAREFDTLTNQLNTSIYVSKMAMFSGMFTKHGTLSAESIIPLSLNIKKNIVDTINRIAEEIYDFDENGVCKRKIHISDDKTIQERYSDICAKHIYYGEDDIQIEMSEEEVASSGGITKIRQEIDSFMTDYFKSKFNLQDAQDTYDAEKTNRMLKSPVKEYIIRYYLMHMYCSGQINHEQWNFLESPEECYVSSLRLKVYLMQYHHTGFQFSKYLTHLEKAVLKIPLPSNTIFDKEIFESEVDKCIEQYIADMKENKCEKQKRLQQLEQAFAYEEDVVDNMKNIKVKSEELMKNMLAIILKMEDADKMDSLLQKYFGEMNELDHVAYPAD
ncbi:MAG: hypothetical protein IKL00_10460 [Oscillospiraceae bacterium]|nr:hypothetical protein [Oscillospiraceae bacterium]